MAPHHLLCTLFLFLLIASQTLAAITNDRADQYVMLTSQSSANSNQPEMARCIGLNKCFRKIMACPKECPRRSTTQQGKAACFIDCSSKCECTCKHRKANCYGYGAVCYDPRFVGGDGIMFYFHGKAGEDFTLLSDRNLHINAHFIGLRPQARKRDYTWVQALGVLYGDHKFSIAAKKTPTWDANVDQFIFSYDEQEFSLPSGRESTWVSPQEDIKIERLAESNSVEIAIDGMVSFTADVVPITQKEDKIHNYSIPKDDCFAHLNVQFKFHDLSASVDGVLGQTYRPDFKNPVKVGTPMPLMGGENKFRVSSLFANDCKACNKFASMAAANHLVSVVGDLNGGVKCSSAASGAGGIVCRR